MRLEKSQIRRPPCVPDWSAERTSPASGTSFTRTETFAHQPFSATCVVGDSVGGHWPEPRNSLLDFGHRSISHSWPFGDTWNSQQALRWASSALAARLAGSRMRSNNVRREPSFGREPRILVHPQKRLESASLLA